MTTRPSVPPGVLGIDVSKHNFDAALLDPSRPDAKPRHKAFPNTPAGFERLQEWLGDSNVHACLEATGPYGDALARFLYESGHTVSVVNPARVKGFGQAQMSRTKTDKADALLIARFCLLHRPEPWTPPAPGLAQLQALVRRLESLAEMRQMERNRRDVSPAVVRDSIDAVLAVLDAQIEATQQAIQGHIDGSPTLRGQRDLLTSIPGIAGTTAAALLAEMGDVAQFTGARQVAAFGSSLRRAGAAPAPVGPVEGARLPVQDRHLSPAPRAVHAGGLGPALQPGDPRAAGAPAVLRQAQDARDRRGDAQTAAPGLRRPQEWQAFR